MDLTALQLEPGDALEGAVKFSVVAESIMSEVQATSPIIEMIAMKATGSNALLWPRDDGKPAPSERRRGDFHVSWSHVES